MAVIKKMNKAAKSSNPRVAAYNSHLRDMKRDAAKRAKDKKVWDTLQKQSANNDGRNTI